MSVPHQRFLSVSNIRSGPVLLGYKDDDLEGDPAWENLPRHGDEDQVRLDVDRSFIYYPTNQSPKDLDRRKQELSTLITRILRNYPYLSYFQGYHDISQVLLLVLGTSSFPALAYLSNLRIRDFMLPTLQPALSQLRLIPSLLSAANPALCVHLSQTQPFFALSGTLTMYAHDIQEYGSIARLFDVLLAREAIFSVYMFGAIVLSRADELFETPSDEPEMLHSILSKLPKPLDVESLIADTIRLFDRYPPEKLKGWWGISRYSVLKTARWQAEMLTQSPGDGKVFLEKQVRELEVQEQRERLMKLAWSYRRPAGMLGMAVLVGVLSFWLRRSSLAYGLLGGLWRQWYYYRGI
jgi:hypothetical protein